ncbi:MAG: O-antigen ligase family protein [Acidobacteriota bacterium]|nr:O-antigen ligase family protein [Acidobacteriota bacterium]
MQKFQLGFCYVALAGFSFGIVLQQSLLTLFAIFSLVLGAMRGGFPTYMLSRARLAVLLFLGVLLLTTWINKDLYPSPERVRIQWPVFVYWVLAPMVVAGIDYRKLHRTLVICSAPGLLYSFYWLLQPDEILHALKVGFTMFPRAHGFESNAITYAEGLTVIGAWSLARLAWDVDPKERRWIRIHLALSVLVIVFSRVRSGLLGFGILFLLHGLLTPHLRKKSLIALAAMMTLFALGTLFFGFNVASLQERVDLLNANLDLIKQSPWIGIGPNKFMLTLENGQVIPEHPHNTLIGILVEAGVVGLCAYLAMIAVLARQLFHVYRARHRPGDPLDWPVRALLYVFVLYHIFGIFDYNFNDTESLLMHGLHWGIITELWRRLPQAGAERTADQEETNLSSEADSVKPYFRANLSGTQK